MYGFVVILTLIFNSVMKVH